MTASKYTRLLMAGTALAGTVALSTAASAGLITTNPTDVPTIASNAVTIVPLGIEALSASTTTANATVLGGAGQTYNFKFLNRFTGKFNVTITLAGANIALSTSNINILQGTGSTAVAAAGTQATLYSCSPQVLTNTVILTGCDASGPSTSGAASSGAATGVQLATVTFTGAGGLNVAGQSIQFSAQVTDSTGAVIFETIPLQSVVTSYQALTQSNTTVGSIAVDATSSPTFTTTTQSAGAINLATGASTNAATSGALTATLGQVSYGTNVATGTGTVQAKKSDFSLMNVNDLIGNHVVTLTSPVLALPAVTQVAVVTLSSTATTAASTVTLNKPVTNPSTVTLAATSTAIDQVVVRASFDGATVIPTTSGGTLVDVPTAGTVTARTFAGQSGTLVGLTQGGYTNGINNILNSKNTGFASYVRIHNNSASSPNTVTLNVYNNLTGALMGSYVSPSVPANGSVQISAADIETGAGITATAGVNYDLGIRGTTFSGYAQHIVFNSALGLAVDLSAARGTTPK